MALLYGLALAGLATAALKPNCPQFTNYAAALHEPFSDGVHKLSYQRPPPECRTASFPEVEKTINEMKTVIKDPDLSRLFENTFPNTLDTTIAWTGLAEEDPDEELSFIITGDINAEWLRDSSNQLQSYRSLLVRNSSSGSLAALYRGAINLQARYVRFAPHCNAFPPPEESQISPTPNDAGGASDHIFPAYPTSSFFECKYELDSLAAFLQLSHDYHAATADKDFFTRFSWSKAVAVLLNITDALRAGTYAADGTLNPSPALFERNSTIATETLANNGNGAPTEGGTGMVRSFFRPSDDSCTYQLFIPANMMFSRYLNSCAGIMDAIDGSLADRMRESAKVIREGIETHGKTTHPRFGEIYSYEVDGFGSHNVMDDANIPSLLSAPHYGYLSANDPVYQNTRRFVLSTSNPYQMRGPVLNATGGPHVGPGNAWPMALIAQLMTSDDDDEIVEGLRQLVSSTDRLGLIHESINSHDASKWTRSWFAWANGLFGQMMLDLRERKPHLLERSYQ
ncbi:Meiotically up-regulated gene 157 protein 1 [Colletotrichum chlorophyti]|uniref:Meiotically up-regulated gene 157 protein 1 n=1 Tax=Colletotrichum chlorophyti TaxID=708187 RepID=A0A1Q8RLD1_9PEZI|nr:Meiotically up-regulated gene 157 protein 1 [Colletotrichum chlorophyti]